MAARFRSCGTTFGPGRLGSGTRPEGGDSNGKKSGWDYGADSAVFIVFVCVFFCVYVLFWRGFVVLLVGGECDLQFAPRPASRERK